MSMIKNQNFGIEIELTGITRKNAVKVIANYFGTTSSYLGSYYQTYGATDRKGRTWKAMSDGSIRTQKKVDGCIVTADSDYSCEVVSPILQYEDIEDLQNIVRELVKAGAMANSSCGIHVHVDGANHTPESLTRLLNLATGRQDLFYEALQIGNRANRWCHKISPELFKAMKNGGKDSRQAAERTWYSTANDGYTGRIDHDHYRNTAHRQHDMGLVPRQMPLNRTRHSYSVGLPLSMKNGAFSYRRALHQNPLQWLHGTFPTWLQSSFASHHKAAPRLLQQPNTGRNQHILMLPQPCR